MKKEICIKCTEYYTDDKKCLFHDVNIKDVLMCGEKKTMTVYEQIIIKQKHESEEK